MKNIRFDSLGMKLSVLFFLLFLTTIPRVYVDGVIEERHRYEQEATASVVNGWAAQHSIGNVTFEAPYTFFVPAESKKEKDKMELMRSYNPESLKIAYKDRIEVRKRGIFKIPIYKADVEMVGEIAIPKEIDPQVKAETLTEGSQRIMFHLPSQAAISEFELEVGGKKIDVTRINETLRGDLPEKTFAVGEKVPFKLKLKMNGYQQFAVRTTAAKLDVSMTSAWPHPSFTGQLPVDQEVGDQGFTARWKLVQAEKNQEIAVDYIQPINVYAQANRALKYGFLITLLCMSVLFLMETLSGLRIHAMQYLLMTLPLTSFYALLLALAEHIGFAAAYAIASFSVVGLLWAYFSGIGSTRKQSLTLTGVLSTVYGLVFSMLASEDHSLLIGSFTLFACLAALMLMTRKVDWSKGILPKGDSHDLKQSASR